MGIEGRLDISFQVEGGKVLGVGIASSRPLRITSLFAGKSPEEVLALIPSLYSICGTAQTCAAVEAFEHALGLHVSPSTRAARDVAVWAETAREHLLRLVMMIGRPSERFGIAEIMPMTQQMKAALDSVFKLGGKGDDGGYAGDLAEHIERLDDFLARAVFGEPLSTWRARQGSATLAQWIAAQSTDVAVLLGQIEQKGWRDIGGAGALDGLPLLKGVDLVNAMKTDDFIAFPIWQGHSYETTPLARQAQESLIRDLMAQSGTGLMTRLAALLVELAKIPDHMRQLLDGSKSETIGEVKEGIAKTAEKGIGLAQVEAARGRLAHAVWMDKGKVSQYRILAPTEWNFHPQGVAAKALKALSFADGDVTELKAQADAVINAIDPCVSYEVRIT